MNLYNSLISPVRSRDTSQAWYKKSFTCPQNSVVLIMIYINNNIIFIKNVLLYFKNSESHLKKYI